MNYFVRAEIYETGFLAAFRADHVQCFEEVEYGPEDGPECIEGTQFTLVDGTEYETTMPFDKAIKIMGGARG